MSSRRSKRLKTLVEWAIDNDILSTPSPFDAIFQDAQTRYPFTRDETLNAYAEDALSILKMRRRQAKLMG